MALDSPLREGGYKATWKIGIQTPMAQGRYTEIISMMRRIRSSSLSIKNPLSEPLGCSKLYYLRARSLNPKPKTLKPEPLGQMLSWVSVNTQSGTKVPMEPASRHFTGLTGIVQA